LTLEEVAKASEISAKVGIDFVKTSTGFFTGGRSDGATPEVLKVMFDSVKGKCKVKASGGIRTRERFLEYIDMGVDRMGIGYKSTGLVLNTTIEDVRNGK
jgi:deoxyribose-phosphate aldolase